MGKREDFDQKVLGRLRKEALLSAGLPTQDLGRFTPVFKSFSPLLKYSPWRIFILLSFTASILALMCFGGRIIRVASILQRGF